MSYRGHGRRKFNNRDDDYYERPRENYESLEDKIRNAVVEMGNGDPEVDLPRVAKQLQEQALSSIPAIAEGFRIGVTEEPFKIPYYAALLRFLHFPTNGLEFPESFGKQVLDDLWKAFQAFLDKLMWREVRLFVQFFGHLTTAQVVSPSSMLSLLRSFVTVLDEFGASHARAKNAGLCATEGLLTAGSILKQHAPEEVTSFISAIQTYAESISFNKSLVFSLSTFGEDRTFEEAEEILESAILILKALDTSDFETISTYYLQPYSRQPELDFSEVPPFELPMVLVPPEIIDMDHLPQEEISGAQTETEKKEEWPEFYIKMFDGAITAQLHDPRGFFIRSLISDVVDIYEVNRKECARLLLEITKWLPAATFKPRSGSAQDVEGLDGPLWQLESCLLETILGKSFLLPEATHNALYYMSLITELCKISPSTVGPAVGKSIRKMYSLHADGLDPEISRRFTDWFAKHMSNFGFQWVWKEWVPDLAEASHHPKRLFIRRAVDIEIRLSYYDRIVKTLPGPFQDPASEAIPEQAPGPEFDYDDPLKPYHEVAQSVLNLLRNRSKADDVINHIESLKSSIAESSDPDVNVETVIRAITIQSLLHVGSRSFSHFLNAVERYLPLLRVLATSAEAKTDILTSVADFWRRNKQMVVIVADKLMQYQIVEPSDVTAWAFQTHGSESSATIDTFKWDLIQGALGKANGRVLTTKKKISMLRKQEDDERARMKASIDVDTEAPPETPVVESPALTTALKAYTALSTEQRTVLTNTLNSFVDALAPHGKILNKAAWDDRTSWTNVEWDVWQTWGWYRNFCRMYAPHMRKSYTSIDTIAFAKYEGSSDEAIALLKNVWNVAMGRES